MENKLFYAELTNYVNKNDIENANRVIMTQIGKILAENKRDFIEVLRNANVLVPDNSSESLLINAFVENAPTNRKLLLGASFLIAHRNKLVGFDGKSNISDVGAKATYKVMYSYFDANDYEDSSDEINYDYYNISEDYSNVWGQLIKGGIQIAKKVSDKSKENKATQQKQLVAQQQIAQEVIRKKQEEEQAKKLEQEKIKKRQNTILIVGGLSLILIGIGTVIYLNRKK